MNQMSEVHSGKKKEAGRTEVAVGRREKKKWRVKLLLWSSLIIIPLILKAQEVKIDSLSSRLQLPSCNKTTTNKTSSCLHDTDRINTLNALGWELMHNNPDTAIILGLQSLELSRKFEAGSTQNKDESFLVTTLNNLGTYNLMKGEYETALNYYSEALSLSEKTAYKKGIATASGNIGIVYSSQNNYPLALENLNKALKMDEELGNKKGVVRHLYNIATIRNSTGENHLALEMYFKVLKMDQEFNDTRAIADDYGNIGNVYFSLGNFTTCLEYFFKALKIYEELKDKRGIAINLGNIGLVYSELKDYEKSLEFNLKSLKINESLNNKEGIAIQYGNIGNVYKSRNDNKKATEYHLKALEINRELDLKDGIGTNLGNLGNIYATMAESSSLNRSEKDSLYKLALFYDKETLKINREIGNKIGIALNSGNIGHVYLEMKEYSKAKEFIQKAIAISDSIDDLSGLMDWQLIISQIYSETGNPALALEHYKKHIEVRDSIFNKENTKKQTQTELQYEFEKKQIADSVRASEHLNQEQLRHQQQIQKQKTYTYGGIAGFLLMLCIAWISFSAFRNKQKANLIILRQKHEVESAKEIIEEKQKEITDSISYALRIQQAILPEKKIIQEAFPQSFILYKPKDIVAGDFYWMAKMETQGDNIIYLAAADCTGHGVPGAMVSVVCCNALNRAVKEFALRDTGKILDKVTELVLETFEKSDSEIKDGMDISLLSFNTAKKEIQWSGANNPLWFLKTTGEENPIVENPLLEIKGDKQPVGKFDNLKPFTTHRIEYSENMIFYLFTDGFADQFGGPKGKKYMYKKFENNIRDIYQLPMDNQQGFLETAFIDWKGNIEQVDDITVIGIRI